MRYCFDMDGTICTTRESFEQSYADVVPLPGAVESLQKLKADGHYIIIQTARHMWTCGGNEGKVLAMGAKLLVDWLEKYKVPYDEIYFGKPHAHKFFDDKAVHHTDWKTTMENINEDA